MAMMKTVWLLRWRCLKGRTGIIGAGACLLLAASVGARTEIDSTATLEVETTITKGTCTVSLGAGTVTSGTGSANLDGALPETHPDDLAAGGVYGVGDFTAILSGCTGRNDAASTPKVAVTGSTVGGNTHLFRDASSAGDARLGVVVSGKHLESGSAWAPNDYLESSGALPVPNVGIGASVLSNAYIPLSLGVSCGDSTSCNVGGGTLNGGDVKATLTFTFEYK